jgi:hypothetical protein
MQWAAYGFENGMNALNQLFSRVAQTALVLAPLGKWCI